MMGSALVETVPLRLKRRSRLGFAAAMNLGLDAGLYLPVLLSYRIGWSRHSFHLS